MTDDRSEERRRAHRRVAREYRRAGYQVLELPRGDSLPPFLRGFAPDLVVTKDDDRAVVEIKTREEMIGSNELSELARTIDAQTGWRLELISLGRRKETVEALPEDWLEGLLAAGLSAYDAGQRDMAVIYLVSVLDELIRDTAIHHRIKGRDRSARALVDELAFQGIIEETTAEVMERAWQQRKASVHGHGRTEALSRKEVMEIIEACRAVWIATQLEAA